MAAPQIYRALDVDREAVVALTLAPLCMAAINYIGRPQVFFDLTRGTGVTGAELSFIGLLWWCAWTFVAYFIVPAIAIKLGGRDLGDFGARLPAWRPYLAVYPAMYVAVVPLVLLSAHTAAFLRAYPFYKFAAERPDLWAWFHLAYSLQFFALEFFFRGYLIFALRRSFGDGAVLVSMVPYCLIHFGKPAPEALGAMVAGLVLGTLALRTGSIVPGAALHYAVALTMDLAAHAVKTGRM